MFSLQWYFLISSYYLTVSNGCSLTALKSVEVTQSCGSFKGGFICLWYLHVFSAVVFPYIFLLFDCFEWALIDCIEKHRGHSELIDCIEKRVTVSNGGKGGEGSSMDTHTN